MKHMRASSNPPAALCEPEVTTGLVDTYAETTCRGCLAEHARTLRQRQNVEEATASTDTEPAPVCRCAEPDTTEDQMYECEADDCVAHDYLAGGGAIGGARWPFDARDPYRMANFPPPGNFALERAEQRLNEGPLPGQPGGPDRDMEEPTLAMRKAVLIALRTEQRSAEQAHLLGAYRAVTCGDCLTGKCHGGDDGNCGCARHEVSVRWRQGGGGSR